MLHDMFLVLAVTDVGMLPIAIGAYTNLIYAISAHAQPKLSIFGVVPHCALYVV